MRQKDVKSHEKSHIPPSMGQNYQLTLQGKQMKPDDGLACMKGELKQPPTQKSLPKRNILPSEEKDVFQAKQKQKQK